MNFFKKIFDGLSKFFCPSTLSPGDQKNTLNQTHDRPEISDDFLREVNNEARNRRLESALAQKIFC